MARFTQDITLNKPDDFVYFIMNDYLKKNGFTMSDWKGEAAYRAGDGFFEGYKYLKWSYANGVFHLEAWLKGTFGGEWDLEGFVGCAMKKPYKTNLMKLMELLQQELPDAVPTVQTTEDGLTADAQQPVQNVVQVKTLDDTKAADMALIFGIISLVLCFSPIFCIVFACLGFSRARMGKNSSKAGKAKAGKICCIVAVSITVLLFILNFAISMLAILLGAMAIA